MADPLPLIRGLHDAFARGDIAAVLATLSADIHWVEAKGFPYGGTFHGPQAVLENVFAKLAGEWNGWSAVPERFVAQDDVVVTLGNYRATFKATGKPIDVPFVHVWTVAGGKATRFHQHTDTAIVLEAMR